MKRSRVWGGMALLTRSMLFLLLVFAASTLWAQGPPFQIDDPVPVDLHHYEFYIFGAMDGTPAEIDSTGPALEFNWGAIPRVQLHVIAPWGSINPSNNPIYAPGGIGPSAFGFIDMETGAKIAFIKESKYIPQIGTFTMFEVPTGSYAKGLGVGKVWYKVPLWLQKNIGHWLLDGGAGETIVPQTGLPQFPIRRIPAEICLRRAIGTRRRGLFPWARGLRHAPDRSLHDDRHWRLLSLQASPGRAVFVLLRPFRSRPNRAVCVRRHVLDLGKRQEKARRELRLVTRADERNWILATWWPDSRLIR